MPKKFYSSSGFTLIELLVVISIIGILTVMALVAYTNITNRANDTKKRADINAIANAYELKYDAKKQLYPKLEASVVENVNLDSKEYKCLLTVEKDAFEICTILSNKQPFCRKSIYGNPETCPTD